MKPGNKTVRVVQVRTWNTPLAITCLLLAALCGGGVAGYQYGIRADAARVIYSVVRASAPVSGHLTDHW